MPWIFENPIELHLYSNHFKQTILCSFPQEQDKYRRGGCLVLTIAYKNI